MQDGTADVPGLSKDEGEVAAVVRLRVTVAGSRSCHCPSCRRRTQPELLSGEVTGAASDFVSVANGSSQRSIADIGFEQRR